MTSGECDRSALVDLAREGRLPASDAAAFAAHRIDCTICEARYRGAERIGVLVRALPDASMDELVLPRVWNRVLVSVAAGEAVAPRLRPWMRRALMASAVVIGGTAVAALALRDSADNVIQPRITASARAVDEVRAPEARVVNAPEVPLATGQGMPPNEPPHATPTSHVAAAHAPSRHATEVDTETVEYEAAIASYRDGNDVDAATRFHRFALAHPRSALLEDATFLEASSLARMGRTEAAGVAAERHLALFPDSFHKRDAMSLVARSHPK
jgi:hypothetical protein